MTTTIERALGILVVAALGGAGVFTQCGDPSEDPRPGPSGRPRASRGRPSLADGADEDGFDRSASPAYGSPDGGAPPAQDEDEPPRCWSIRVVDPTGRPTSALVLATPRPDGDLRPADRPQELRVPPSGEVELCTTAWVDVDIDAWTDDGGWGRAFAWIGGPDDVPREPSGPVEVVVFAPTAVRGRVVDAGGAPVAGARVRAAFYFGADQPCGGVDESLAVTGAAEHLTDADGRFELPIGRLGLYTICAAHEGYVTAASGSVAARPGADREVELVLETEARFTGVVEHDGRPIPGASVRVLSEHVTTTLDVAADGTFDLGGLRPDERLDVHVWAPGFVARSFDLVPVGSHRLTLARGANVTVRVSVDPALDACARALPYLVGDWRPVHDIVVEAHAGDETIGSQVHASGDVVRLTELRAGPTRLVAWAYGVRVERTVTTVPGAPTEVTLPLELGASQGILRLEGGSDHRASGLVTLLRHEDPDGHVSLRFLDPGEASCRVERVGVHRLFAADQLVASPRVVAGQVTREILNLPPAPPAPPQDEDRACEVPVDTVHVPNRSIVAEAAPGTGLLPGDELLEVEEDDDRWGPPGTSARLRVRRPDGSEATLTIPRTRCD